MSLLSSYIKREIKKRGTKGFILRILSIVTKLTPSKADDILVEQIKKVLDKHYCRLKKLSVVKKGENTKAHQVEHIQKNKFDHTMQRKKRGNLWQ